MSVYVPPLPGPPWCDECDRPMVDSMDGCELYLAGLPESGTEVSG